MEVAAVAAGAHESPLAAVVLLVAVVLVAAKLGGELAVRLRQPAVLGELVIGVLLGNLHLLGWGALESARWDPALDLLAQLGVLILLFEIGLESTVGQMMKVGVTSLVVAVLGVAAPFGLGWLVGAWLLPDAGTYVHLFLGATLSATSVGITARVLKDVGRSDSDEARVILGAAVIDDVLGLVVLAVVTGAIAAADQGGSVSALGIGWIVLKAALFLFGSLAVGVTVSRRVFFFASKLRARGVLLALGLAFCFFLAWLSTAVGLAPIVGAFAAGLILEDVHYRDFTDRGEHGLDDLVRPISSFLAPIFFVLMGMRTDLRSFASAGVLGLAGALTLAALAGKQACGLGVRRGLDRLSIGIGMIPRGEVGLIFANIGLGLTLHGRRILDEATFSAVVMMVIVTTLVAPPALTWSLRRKRAC